MVILYTIFIIIQTANIAALWRLYKPFVEHNKIRSDEKELEIQKLEILLQDMKQRYKIPLTFNYND
jgi:hypothetical protein